MRTNLISGFQLSVSYWFDLVLQGMGGPIRDWVYDFLDKKGIKRDDIPARFGDVVKILHERFGGSSASDKNPQPKTRILKTPFGRQLSVKVDQTAKQPRVQKTAFVS